MLKTPRPWRRSKKLCREPRPDHSSRGSRQAGRDLVSGRGPDRPEKQDHTAMGAARDTALGTTRSGTVRNFVRGWAVQHNQAIALVKRSPKRTANWALAIHHSRGGMIHSFSERFKTRKSSFVAASSLGKCPLALNA